MPKAGARRKEVNYLKEEQRGAFNLYKTLSKRILLEKLPKLFKED